MNLFKKKAYLIVVDPSNVMPKTFIEAIKFLKKCGVKIDYIYTAGAKFSIETFEI
tara:strand:- start:16237 stop:16401 length:165 start_codon:yes stop_codon:yes gene_type:complete